MQVRLGIVLPRAAGGICCWRQQCQERLRMMLRLRRARGKLTASGLCVLAVLKTLRLGSSVSRARVG